MSLRYGRPIVLSQPLYILKLGEKNVILRLIEFVPPHGNVYNLAVFLP